LIALVGRIAAAALSVGALSAAAVGCLPDDTASGDASVIEVSSADELAATFASAAPGTTIELLSGTYKPRQLRRSADAASVESPVRLRAKPGEIVEVQDLDVAGPLAVERIHLTGIIRFRAAAAGSSLANATVRPGNVIVEADDVSIVDNQIQGPPDRDALDIGATDGTGPFDVVVRGNTLGPGTLSPGSPAHVDCLQVMSGERLLIEDNLLYDCPAQTLLVKSDLGPIHDVTVIRNALRGCRPRTESCPAYMTLQLVPGAHPMSDVHVEGNSIAGALRAVAGFTGVQVASNAMTRIEAGCEYLTTGNVIGTAGCAVPPGNLMADPAWIDVDSDPPDLRPAPLSAAIDQAPTQSRADLRGTTDPCGEAWDAGAFERCN
jgi:hypothetical protein